MKIIFHPRYHEVYSNDPAAAEGRLDSAVEELTGVYPFVEPQPATVQDIARVHTAEHIEVIKRDEVEYNAALLAAGGAIITAELAVDGEPAFGLIRPPGHHASPDHCWGFCFFNNMAVSIEAIRKSKKIKRVFILDFDLHTGDGNLNSFANDSHIEIFNPDFPGGREGYMNGIAEQLKALKSEKFDLVAASAGFDNYEHDWGSLLRTEDFKEIGRMMKEFAESRCGGRRYALLEGGYNYNDLGKNIKAFLKGLE
ncbi:MAG: histone deacetylase family protein [Thermoplasmata archaeon]|nr:MAG: histone deacetylase family protein [Thermoplasmata archaeon]